jgi:hypothetical protein
LTIVTILLQVITTQTTTNTGIQFSAEWVNAIAALLAAAGTIGAVLIVLFGPLFKGPKLSVDIQHLEGSTTSYWHQTSTPVPTGIPGTVRTINFSQLRVWVSNNRRQVAKSCRVKLKIIQNGLGGRDAPIEFTLPAFLYYRPIINPATGFLPAPEPGQVSIDIAAHSKEAFELLWHVTGMQECHPYSVTTFPLETNTGYQLKIRAYADGASPSKEVTFNFFWDGVEGSLTGSVMPGMSRFTG